MELGCDAHGYSRAGVDTTTWYCAVLAGRLGPELDKMREVSFSLFVFFDYFSNFSLYVCVVFLRLFSIPHTPSVPLFLSSIPFGDVPKYCPIFKNKSH